jgi:hypothetical protein
MSVTELSPFNELQLPGHSQNYLPLISCHCQVCHRIISLYGVVRSVTELSPFTQLSQCDALYQGPSVVKGLSAEHRHFTAPNSLAMVKST